MAKIPRSVQRPAVKARATSRKATKAGMAAVAPLGIAGGILTAVNVARKEGSSIGDAALMDGLDTAKSFATYGAAQYAVTYGAMKVAGMGLARATGVGSLAISAYGAVDGAIDARKAGTSMLAGAAKGAWEYSLPGMIWDGAKETYKGVKDYRAAQTDERTRFDEANAHWQKGAKQYNTYSGDTFERTRRDARSGKMITETVRKRGKGNSDWDIGIDPKKTAKDDSE